MTSYQKPFCEEIVNINCNLQFVLQIVIDIFCKLQLIYPQLFEGLEASKSCAFENCEIDHDEGRTPSIISKWKSQQSSRNTKIRSY